jgi:Pyruvate/2-oxoacid:ferredoxin oxidoreductase delta subunit
MQRDGLPLADMDYCKGCSICVLECWTGCIEMIEEKD